MTGNKLKFDLVGPPPEGMEGEIRDCFSKGHKKKGFDLLRTHLYESHQLHVFTVYSIINSFEGHRRIYLLGRLRSQLFKYRLPKVLNFYLNFIRSSFNNDMIDLKLAINRLAILHFPLDILAKNLYADSHFHLVVKISRRKKFRKDVDNLEILMRSYIGLHNWDLAKETANKILLVDPQNMSAICILARFSISEGDYIGALNSLKEVENINSNNVEVQYLMATSSNYIKQIQKVNAPIGRPDDILIDQSVYGQKSSSAYKELDLNSRLKFKKKLNTIDADVIEKTVPFDSIDTLIINNRPTPIVIKGNSYRTFWLSTDLIKDPLPVKISAEQHTLLYFLALELKQRSTKNNAYWMVNPYKHLKELGQAYKSVNIDLEDVLQQHIEKHKKRYKDMTDGYSGQDLNDRIMLFYRMVISKWPFERGNYIRKRHVSTINSEVKKSLNVEDNLLFIPQGYRGQGGIYTISENITSVNFVNSTS